MRIIIVALEFPYPPNHGAKVDIWNRILAFKNAGHSVSLVTWQGIKKGVVPSNEDLNIVQQTVDQLTVLDIARNGFRVLNLFKYPSLVAARLTTKETYREILKRSMVFSPDFIFIDSIYGALIGNKLAKDLKLPLAIRLHNIESSYMRGQFFLSKGFKNKLSVLAACFHLKSFEKKVIAKSDAFFDISMEDLKYWKNKGFSHGYWLPTILSKSDSNTKSTTLDYDIGFLGNLNAPNNVEGLKWFINSVIPFLVIKFPSLRILILGSEPSDEIITLCNSNKSIKLIANPVNPAIHLNSVNVLINPVKFGSGVNIKSVEMLMRDNEVVSTSVGIKGMPKEISNVFFIADTPEQFSDSISNILLHNYRKDMKLRHEMREMFEEKSIEIVFRVMTDIMPNNSLKF